MERARDRTGLMVVVKSPASSEASGSLLAALAACTVPCVLMTGSRDQSPETGSLRRLLVAAQDAGAAALLQGNLRLAQSLGADGVHLPWSTDLREQYEEARTVLGADAIVGIDAGSSRHDAMVLGEAGADYVSFGAAAHGDDVEAARESRLDLVAWWAALFEVPCVAFDVSEPDEARLLAQTGADFLAVSLGMEKSATDVACHLRAIEDGLPTEPRP